MVDISEIIYIFVNRTTITIMDKRVIFGKRLKSAREMKGLSMANLVGCPHPRADGQLIDA